MTQKLGLKDLWEKDAFKTFSSGYKIDRRIFNFCMIFIFAWLFFVAYHYDFNLDYFECIAPSMNQAVTCKNPFYHPADWKTYQELPPGVYGQKPTFLFKTVYWLPFVAIFACLILNHLIHNRGIDLFGKNNLDTGENE
jgi:hypothetical protein